MRWRGSCILFSRLGFLCCGVGVVLLMAWGCLVPLPVWGFVCLGCFCGCFCVLGVFCGLFWVGVGTVLLGCGLFGVEVSFCVLVMGGLQSLLRRSGSFFVGLCGTWGLFEEFCYFVYCELGGCPVRAYLSVLRK